MALSRGEPLTLWSMWSDQVSKGSSLDFVESKWQSKGEVESHSTHFATSAHSVHQLSATSYLSDLPVNAHIEELSIWLDQENVDIINSSNISDFKTPRRHLHKSLCSILYNLLSNILTLTQKNPKNFVSLHCFSCVAFLPTEDSRCKLCLQYFSQRFIYWKVLHNRRVRHQAVKILNTDESRQKPDYK